MGRAPELNVSQILGWADAFHRRTGRWPRTADGPIPETLTESWRKVNSALYLGLRGLSGGSSLARLLAERRGLRNPQALPPFEVPQILGWADAHHRRTGRWPTCDGGGAIPEAPGENWKGVDSALRMGLRGLPGASSLTRLLAERRGVRNRTWQPPLTTQQILAWADAHRRRTGRWPDDEAGPIPGAPEETWKGVHKALQRGTRGLPGGSSLARCLAEHRGLRHQPTLPRLTPALILTWAEAHQRHTGRWPHGTDGPIGAEPGETWSAVDKALQLGLRGLRGGSSLARLLAKRRGVRSIAWPRRLSVRQILSWADMHRRRTGTWPNSESGPIPESPGETWLTVHLALKQGRRGFPGGDTVSAFLRAHGRSNGLPRHSPR